MGPPRISGGRAPPRSGSGREPTPWKWWWKRIPQKWWWKRTPPQGKDQTRPAEKYCWASWWYALEEKAFLLFLFPFSVGAKHFYCLPKGRHSDGAHEFQGCSSQKCSRGGVGVGVGWGGVEVGQEGVGWGGVGWGGS